MSSMERALGYAGIFLNVGEEWQNYRPVDSTLGKGVLHLQGVRMRPVGDTWELTENDQVIIVQKREVKTS